MDCIECQKNISMFLDGELEEDRASSVRTHLTLCRECAKLCEDFAAILDSCREGNPSELLPPNPKALWCRINNIIESDDKPAQMVQQAPKRFSFLQRAVAVAFVALISSLLTIVGIRNYFEPSGDDFTTRSAATQTTLEKILSKVGLTDTPQQSRAKRLAERQTAMEYWNKRVQMRRASWDNKMRDVFDRNLRELDAALHEYTMILEQDPQDELSGEMLDSALDEKMKLLREFSEL